MLWYIFSNSNILLLTVLMIPLASKGELNLLQHGNHLGLWTLSFQEIESALICLRLDKPILVIDTCVSCFCFVFRQFFAYSVSLFLMKVYCDLPTRNLFLDTFNWTKKLHIVHSVNIFHYTARYVEEMLVKSFTN